MDESVAADPRAIWPVLTDWHPVGMHEQVYRVRTTLGEISYLRPDDGSTEVLRRLAGSPLIPAPRVIESRAGWLLLSALTGVRLSDRLWVSRPMVTAAIVADALRRLDRADVRHGDMCLPNILGDPERDQLSGIVDWGDAGKFGREIDVAATIWSCGFNGYSDEVALAVLRGCGWPGNDIAEVSRLSDIWTAVAGQPDA